MNHGKVYLSDIEVDELSKKFRLLSEPSRLKILRALFSGEKCVNEIIKETGLLQANVSKQLKALNDLNIVTCRSEGLQRYYRVIDPKILGICNTLCGK
jgi:DNA-binding transcriptional ArsR family regulator